MLKKFVVFKKMCNFAPENIVEPFNHERKGRTNEYKVGYYPHRALVTAANWLRHNIVVTMPSSHFHHIINIAGI